jgi:hypothetical protein
VGRRIGVCLCPWGTACVSVSWGLVVVGELVRAHIACVYTHCSSFLCKHGLSPRPTATVPPSPARACAFLCALAGSRSALLSTFQFAGRCEASVEVAQPFENTVGICLAYSSSSSPTQKTYLAVASEDGFVSIVDASRPPLSLPENLGRASARWEAHQNLIHDISWAKVSPLHCVTCVAQAEGEAQGLGRKQPVPTADICPCLRSKSAAETSYSCASPMKNSPRLPTYTSALH